MTDSIIDDLISMADEPIITEENDEIMERLIIIERTSEFEPMGLTEEKLDELVESLGNQENFASEITSLSQGLERVQSIVLEVDNDEEDYI